MNRPFRNLVPLGIAVHALVGCSTETVDSTCDAPPAFQPSAGDVSASLAPGSFVTVSANGSMPTLIALSHGEVALRPESPGCEGVPGQPCRDDLRAVELDVPDFRVGEVEVVGLTLRLRDVLGLIDEGGGIALAAATPGSGHAVVDGACMHESATWNTLVVRVGAAFQPAPVQGNFTITFDVPRRVRPTGIVNAFRLDLDGTLLCLTEEWHTAL